MKETFPPRPVFERKPYSRAGQDIEAFRKFREEERAWFEELLAHPHVQAVMHIPSDEPIFVVRASQGEPALVALHHFQLECVERGTLKIRMQEEFDSSADATQRLADWQSANRDKVKVPD